MSIHTSRQLIVRGMLMIGLSFGIPLSHAQNTPLPDPAQAPAVTVPADQAMTGVGEAAADLGGSLRTGGRKAADQGRKLWHDALLPAAQRTASALPGVLKGLLLLLAFWIAGKLAGTCVRKLLTLTRIDERAMRDWGLESLLKKPDGQMRSLAALAGNTVKWLLLLFGFVAFFNALNLSMVAGPLQNVLDRIVGTMPNLLKAAVILFIYWVLAAVIRAGVTRALNVVKFDERAGKHLSLPQSEGQAVGPSAMVGRLLFYIILLFGVPPFLEALDQQALVLPLQDMLSKALGFLPNIFAAALILIVGRIVATIVREVVGNFLAACGADTGAEKLGLTRMLGANKLSGIIGRIAYFFIFIPILVSAVDSLGIKAISDPIKATLQKILEAVPALLVALVIVAIGYMVAKIVRSLVEAFLSGVGLDGLPSRLGLTFLEPKPGQMTLSGLVGAAVSVVIMLITAQQATATLEFTQLSELLRRIVEYLPSLVVGLVILLAALSLGKHVGALVTSTMGTHAHAKVLSNVARYAITLLGAGMALEQLGVGKEIVMVALGALLGGTALALGLAFGLGGKDRAKEVIERWNRTD